MQARGKSSFIAEFAITCPPQFPLIFLTLAPMPCSKTVRKLKTKQ